MNKLFTKTGQLLALLCLSTNLISAGAGQRGDLEDDSFQCYVEERGFLDPFFSYSFANYTIKSLGFFGENVVISDGSTWKIRPSDTTIVNHWNDLTWTNDWYSSAPSKIFITTNNNWLINKQFPYCLVNRDTKDFVFCDMSKSSPYEDQVVRIDYIEYNTGYVELLDRNGLTACYLNKSDYNIYSKWKGGQLIMRGVNTGNNSNAYPYLLINVNTLTNARCSLTPKY